MFALNRSLFPTLSSQLFQRWSIFEPSTRRAPASCSSSIFLLIAAATVNNPWSLLSNGRAWASALSFARSSRCLSSGQIFIRPAQCLTWQGSMDITCGGCSEATGWAWWGRAPSRNPSSALTAPIKREIRFAADENVYLTAHAWPPTPLSLLYLAFDLMLWLGSVAHMVWEQQMISKKSPYFGLLKSRSNLLTAV